MQKNSVNHKPTRRYIKGLDGLRAFAIIGVTFYHFFPQTVKGGFLGVSLFFILSGYLMAITSENEWAENKFNIKEFYKKRVSRIYPSLFIIIVVTVSVATVLAPATLKGIRSELLSIFGGYNNWWQIAQNASYFTKITSSSPYVHMWSLAVELQFYVLWPFIFLIYKKLESTRLGDWAKGLFLVLALLSGGAMAALYQPGADPSRVYYGTDTRAFALLLGVFLGLIEANKTRKHVKESHKKYVYILFALCFSVLIISFWLVDAQKDYVYWGGLFAFALFHMLLVALVADPRFKIGILLNIKPLLLLGKRSYGIYLWQYPVMFYYGRLVSENKTFVHILAQIIIIVALSEITDTIVKKWQKGLNIHKNFDPIAAYSAIIIAFVLVVISAYGIVGAQKAGMSEDQIQLEAELAANREMLEKQKADALKTEQQQPIIEPEPVKETQPEKESASEKKEPAVVGKVTAIGDSVMLGAAPELQNAIPGSTIDAAESRQVRDCLAIITELKQQNQLGDTIIIALGTNGTFDQEVGQELMDSLGSERKVYWITVYGDVPWRGDVNKTIENLAQNNANLELIDWSESAKANPEWFYDDGLHLKPDGRVEYAAAVANAIYYGD